MEHLDIPAGLPTNFVKYVEFLQVSFDWHELMLEQASQKIRELQSDFEGLKK